MLLPIHCHISSDDPMFIRKVCATQPGTQSPSSGSIRFHHPSFGPSHLADAVLGSYDWKIFEDGVLLAQGDQRKAQPMVPMSSIKTGYIRAFLEAL